jgi:hypothetical protein
MVRARKQLDRHAWVMAGVRALPDDSNTLIWRHYFVVLPE